MKWATASSPLANTRRERRRPVGPSKARFTHVWTLRDGVIVRLQQCAEPRKSRRRWAKTSTKENDGMNLHKAEANPLPHVEFARPVCFSSSV